MIQRTAEIAGAVLQNGGDVSQSALAGAGQRAWRKCDDGQRALLRTLDEGYSWPRVRELLADGSTRAAGCQWLSDLLAQLHFARLCGTAGHAARA